MTDNNSQNGFVKTPHQPIENEIVEPFWQNGSTDNHDDWLETTLGEVCEIIGGGTPKTTVDEYWNGDIPWLSVVDFNDNNRWVSKTEKTITEKGLKESSTKVLNTGDLIISARGTVGALAQVKKDMAFNQSCYGIKEKKGFSDKNFLFYLIKQSLSQIGRNVHGAVFDTITRETFNHIQILLPPLPEQQAISSVLSAFDDKIELLREQNKTLEATAQTIFQEWFGTYGVDDELPDGWRVGTIVDFEAEITDYVANGSFASLKENVTLYDTENYALFLRNTDLKSNFIQKVYVDERSYNFLKKTQMHGGEIIISNVGDVGSVYFCPFLDIPMVLGNNVICLKSKYQSYFYSFFTNRIGQHLISSITAGSAQPKFNKTDFRNMKLVVPQKEILKNFDETIQPIFAKIRDNSEQIQSLARSRDELLPRLMSGVVRVNF